MFFIFIAKTSDCMGKGKINSRGLLEQETFLEKYAVWSRSIICLICRLYSSQSTLISVFAAVMAADTNLFYCILQVYWVDDGLNYKLLMRNITGEKQRKDFNRQQCLIFLKNLMNSGENLK